MNCLRAFLWGTTILACAAPAYASVMNRPPPTGPVVLDLNGSPVPHDYKPYRVDFTATSASTDLSFAFRDDQRELFLDDVAVTMSGGPNLVVNGDFEAGKVNAEAPVGWDYLGPRPANGGFVASSAAPNGGNAYEDGAVGGYDAITQRLLTQVGESYTLTFELEETGSLDTFSALSTNGLTGSGGNAVDLLVYAGSGLPIQSVVPLPSAAPMLGAALLAFGLASLGVRHRATREG